MDGGAIAMRITYINDAVEGQSSSGMALHTNI